MNDILKGLKELTENLKSGKPIEIIKVKREQLRKYDSRKVNEYISSLPLF